MDNRLLVFAGPKQSGKTSGANFVSGFELKQQGKIRQFGLDEEGKLVVNSYFMDENGDTKEGEGVLDLQRRDPEFFYYASNNIWPHVKLYNFADPLKEALATIFGLSLSKLNGTDEEKNELTHIAWKLMARFLPPRTVKKLKDDKLYNKKMTHRQVMQEFGTSVCRHLDDDCWVRACLDRIKSESPELAIIADCRFENEVKAAKKRGAKIIRLKPKVATGDIHTSETSLDNIPDSYFDLVLDKNKLSLKEKNSMIVDAMAKWGWLQTEVMV